jgi:hypothetical protein
MQSFESETSGLNQLDEDEPKAQILADVQESIRQAVAGQTFPISELWDGIDEMRSPKLREITNL